MLAPSTHRRTSFLDLPANWGWGVVSAVRIAAALHQRGVNVHPLLLNVLIFRYLYRYRAMTLQETGKTGWLFYACVFAMNLALVAAITGLVVRVAWGA